MASRKVMLCAVGLSVLGVCQLLIGAPEVFRWERLTTWASLALWCVVPWFVATACRPSSMLGRTIALAASLGALAVCCTTLLGATGKSWAGGDPGRRNAQKFAAALLPLLVALPVLTATASSGLGGVDIGGAGLLFAAALALYGSIYAEDDVGPLGGIGTPLAIYVLAAAGLLGWQQQRQVVLGVRQAVGHA